jgi:hypothetical protein
MIHSTLNCNHKYLRYTNLLLILSILFFFLTSKQKSIAEYICALFLMIIIISSQLFWNNPIKGSRIHKIDAIIAKIVVITLVLYTLIYKFKFDFLIVLFAMCITFCLSHYYSSQEWCSNKHLVCHGLLHISCFIATLYTFSLMPNIY